jgi:hypothetical protein
MNTVFSSVLTALINYISGIFAHEYQEALFSTQFEEKTTPEGDSYVILITTIKLNPSNVAISNLKKELESYVEQKEEPKVEKEEPKVEQKEEPKVEQKEEPKVEQKEEPKVEQKEEPKVEKKKVPKVEQKEEPFIVVGKKTSKKSKKTSAPKPSTDKIQSVFSERIEVYFKKVADFEIDFDDDLYEQFERLIQWTDITQSKNLKESNLSISMFEEILNCIIDNYYSSGISAQRFYGYILIQFVNRVKYIYHNASKGFTIDMKQVDIGRFIESFYREGFEESFKRKCEIFLENSIGCKGWSKESRAHIRELINSFNL